MNLRVAGHAGPSRHVQSVPKGDDHRHVRPAQRPHLCRNHRLIEVPGRKSNDRIVGAHILGHSGSELIHLFAFAMAHGISAGQMRETVYVFPTMASDIRNLL